MKELLNPLMQNYRATDKMDGDFVVANAQNYYYQGSVSYLDNAKANAYVLADLVKGEDGAYYTADGNPM